MSYRILGIDPGTAIVGWGVISVDNERVSTVAYGHIETLPTKSDTERLCAIRSDLCDIIGMYSPDAAAVEKLFFFKNHKTVITVAQARGVILEVCGAASLVIGEYTPLQIKQSLTSYGRANKLQVQEMITKTLGLKKIPQPDDTADALAVALCHKNSYRFAQKINSL